MLIVVEDFQFLPYDPCSTTLLHFPLKKSIILQFFLLQSVMTMMNGRWWGIIFLPISNEPTPVSSPCPFQSLLIAQNQYHSQHFIIMQCSQSPPWCPFHFLLLRIITILAILDNVNNNINVNDEKMSRTSISKAPPPRLSTLMSLPITSSSAWRITTKISVYLILWWKLEYCFITLSI